ncbi:predicted protein [Histoplasma mississippiense (nom. inval.)]|uniref:predicted protein n=1 Tax=Ajellomyces capsulatus (strain NAm1 / WU24) TaxID=2059318 RepID=UPI000157D2C5|nr:predicted protein [Histoplasma mississippiense (nom. inval.)]EDN04889.1 predicted protein [Histoplasma mississippiense (nom. inval.)]
MLGKRKRDVVVVTRQIRQEDSDIQSLSLSADEKQDILRKVFESRFGPVEALVKPIAMSPEEPSHPSLAEGNDDEWEGLSDKADTAASEQHPSTEVVEHTTSWNPAKDILDKPARKSFMPPPSSIEAQISTPNTKRTGEAGAAADDQAI